MACDDGTSHIERVDGMWPPVGSADPKRGEACGQNSTIGNVMRRRAGDRKCDSRSSIMGRFAAAAEGPTGIELCTRGSVVCSTVE